jgi:hypothetical protein
MEIPATQWCIASAPCDFSPALRAYSFIIGGELRIVQSAVSGEVQNRRWLALDQVAQKHCGILQPPRALPVLEALKIMI